MGVTTTTADRVAVVMLDWPERRNALGPPEATELAAALQAAGDDDASSVVIVSGNGAFCAGGDLRALVDIAADGPAAIREVIYNAFHAAVRAIVEMRKPVLAAVDGPAVGLGMDLALACDWRALGPKGWMRQGWGALGVIPGTGGELLLRRLAPSLTWSLLGTSARIEPREAAELGLGEEAPAGAMEAARERANALATLPTAALDGYVRLHRHELRERLDRHLELCVEIQTELVASDEFGARARRLLEGDARR
jgi:enoyl-CoA hydratase/carnithine racemase